MTTRTINVDYIARVEGEGALDLEIQGDEVTRAHLRIFEPPRFFEAFLRDRYFTEAPDITARICGICPVAYLMGACHAMEMACGVTVDGPIRDLRRLLYCGEWIESHVLHTHMLHLPDFMGYQDAIRLAKDHPEPVKRALRMKKIGNDIMTVLGGREIHPINVKVGGFYKVPTESELKTLRDDLVWGLDAAIETVKLVSTLEFPDFEQDYNFFSICHPNEYPLNEGRLVSSKGVDVPISEYDNVLEEVHVAHSTSLQSRTQAGGPAHLGPLARYAMNYDKLSPAAKQIAEAVGLPKKVTNPFKSILVRSVEVVYAFEEALRIIDNYTMPDKPAFEVEPKAGTGYGATEAPRGICYHRYTINDEGIITDAKIVAPTSVNQQVIESDLYHYVQPNVHLPDDKLQWVCEQAIRNYDPCISCSCHFLKLNVKRS